MDSLRGRRWMITLIKLPRAAPKAAKMMLITRFKIYFSLPFIPVAIAVCQALAHLKLYLYAIRGTVSKGKFRDHAVLIVIIEAELGVSIDGTMIDEVQIQIELKLRIELVFQMICISGHIVAQAI